MKHGELSNTVGYSFGFRCEDFLVRFKTSTLVDKAYNALFDKARRAEIDEEVYSFMEYIYRETEYTVDLIIDRKNYTDSLKDLISDLPFNRIVLVDKPSQISSRLLVGDLTYYIDNDDERRSLVNSKYTRTLDELKGELRRRARR